MMININDRVAVKLTPRGKAMIPREWRSHLREDANGWSEWQLWELMQTFGQHTHLGCEPPFETQIKLCGDRYDIANPGS